MSDEELREEVFGCLDNSHANGYDTFHGTAEQLAADLIRYVAELEELEPPQIAGLIAEWRLANIALAEARHG